VVWNKLNNLKTTSSLKLTKGERELGMSVAIGHANIDFQGER